MERGRRYDIGIVKDYIVDRLEKLDKKIQRYNTEEDLDTSDYYNFIDYMRLKGQRDELRNLKNFIEGLRNDAKS